MSKRWKRPTRSEIDRIRAECKERGISDERAEVLIADARRSPEEAEQYGKEELAKWEAEHPERTGEELRTWHDEVRGFQPPRRLPADSAVYLPGWRQDWPKRQPHAPTPWFWIEGHHGCAGVWDGRCFVRGGWEEVEPHPRTYRQAWDMAFLYPSARDCLDVAVEISAQTGVECVVQAHPASAYYPQWEVAKGVILDLMRLRWWVRLMVQCANSHYNAGLDPLTPLPHWIMREYLPPGTLYPVNGLYFWYPDCRAQLWDRLQREFAPPTYVEILARRGDRSCWE